MADASLFPARDWIFSNPVSPGIEEQSILGVLCALYALW